MVECRYLEWVDSTPWHGDVFDHPSYKSFCQLFKREVHSHYTCTKCSSYTPNYESLSDDELKRELHMVTELLESDDRMQPMSAYVACKLSYQRKDLLSEANRRHLDIK